MRNINYIRITEKKSMPGLGNLLDWPRNFYFNNNYDTRQVTSPPYAAYFRCSSAVINQQKQPSAVTIGKKLIIQHLHQMINLLLPVHHFLGSLFTSTANNSSHKHTMFIINTLKDDGLKHANMSFYTHKQPITLADQVHKIIPYLTLVCRLVHLTKLCMY